MLVSRRENVGRELFTVDFDTGQRLILFAHEIEPTSEEPDAVFDEGTLGAR